jgi:predicted transcriptional regulator of viral defense system
LETVEKEVVAPRHLVDHLIAHGRSVITLGEFAEITELSLASAADAAKRLRQSGRLFSPTRGLYVMIPPQYRKWGVVPAADFIDPFMHAVSRGYYVSLLSAAELHGAAHQRPQVFQVMVDRPLADRDFGRVHLRFHTQSRLKHLPVQRFNSATGQFLVSTPGITALDLASRPSAAGGLGNVATVLAELVEATDLGAQTLLKCVEWYPMASLRRLGWLLDLAARESNYLIKADFEPLARVVALSAKGGHRSQTLLDPHGPRRGRNNEKWGLVENTEVETDL